MIEIPAKVKRIMMKHGTSGVVTIPMSYRKYHDLNPGDEMIVLYDTLILMAPKSMEHIVEDRQELIDELLGVMKKPIQGSEQGARHDDPINKG